MASLFEKSKVRLLLDEPFYATLMLNLEPVECEKLPDGRDLWLAATDGSHLYFNPTNFSELSVEQGVFVIKHELRHVAQLHPFRVGARDGRRWNEATDYVINDQAADEGDALIDGIQHDPSRFTKDMAAEEVYNLLPEKPPGGGGQGQGQGGDGGNPLDGDVLPAPDQSQAAEQAALENVVSAAQVAKAMGKLPAWAKSFLGDLLEPKVAWEEALRRFLTEVTETDYSFARPNRRFIAQDIYLPGKYGNDGMGMLSVVFDTSGSVSTDEMRRFASEVVEAVDSTNPTGLCLIYCDAQVQHVDTFHDPTVDEVTDSIARYGAGGTDMTVALDWIDDNMPDTKAAIVFTDGYTPFGNDRDYPVMWAVTEQSIKAPFGETIFVEV